MKQGTTQEIDDNEVREIAMLGGTEKVCRWNIGPTAAAHISYMQRTGVLGDEMDLLWKACAFVFIHSEPLQVVRSAAKEVDKFRDCVDDWMIKHNPKDSEIHAIWKVLNERTLSYFASTSSKKSDSSGGESMGNETIPDGLQATS